MTDNSDRRQAGRILMLLGNNPYPGDLRVLQEAVALRAAGHEVTVIAQRAAGQRPRDEIDGVRVLRYRPLLKPQGFFGYLIEYVQAPLAIFYLSLRASFGPGVDVIHAHNPPDTLWAVGAVYKLFGKRFVFDHHDIAPEMYRARFGDRSVRPVELALRVMERVSYWLADHVIVTNGSYRQLAIERGRLAPDDVTVVRNGPDLNRLQRVAPQSELRSRASIILGYVGVIGYQDGVERLLRALHHLVYDLERRDTLAVLIGAGDAFEEMRELATSLKLDDHVWFTGWVHDATTIATYLCTADICVDPAPSNDYNDRSTMIKIMEYMALGRPVVAFDLPEHRVTAGEAAVYVEPNDERAFARAIASLADDPAKRQRMGELGRERVLAELDWALWARPLVETYDRLL